MELSEIKKVDLRKFAKVRYGISCNQSGNAHCPFHPPDTHPSFSFFQDDGGIWRWVDHHILEANPGRSGTIVDLVARMENISDTEACQKLIQEFNVDKPALESLITKYREQLSKKPEETNKLKLARLHIYFDREGRETYLKAKIRSPHGTEIWQFYHEEEGKLTPGQGPFEAIPYNLDEFKEKKEAIVCEGEKDADLIAGILPDIAVTSAPYGKESWPDSLNPHFSQFRKVTFLYDVGNENCAESHARKLISVFPEIDIYIAKVPLANYDDDISDYLGQFPESEDKEAALRQVLSGAVKYEPRTAEPIRSPEADGDGETNFPIHNSFLSRYIRSISRVTDAPKIFILFSAIALLSAILSKFFFKFPRKTHLNLYVLLLAPSTYYRKTTCIDIAGDHLEACNPELKLPENFTVESLFKIPSGNLRGGIFWPELNQVKEFLAAKKYNDGLLAVLTDIYDYKKTWKRVTVKDGITCLEEPVISILAGGISDWFADKLRMLDFQGGIWTRFLFVQAPKVTRRYSLPKPFSLDPQIVSELKALDNLSSSEVDFSQVQALIQDWGERHQEETMRLGAENPFSALYQRLEIMLLKLAGILQISQDKTTTVTPQAFQEAVGIIDYIKSSMPAFLNEDIQFGEYGKARASILKFIKSRGQAKKGEILQGTKVPSKDADPILKQLDEEEEIVSEQIPNSRAGGRKGTLYKYIGGQRR